MARTNLKRVKRTIEEAAQVMVERLAAEREIDSAHIEAHAEASKKHLDKLATEEQRLLTFIEESRTALNGTFDAMVTGVKSLFGEQRTDEEARLRSLQAHADEINDDGDELEEPPEKKRITNRR